MENQNNSRRRFLISGTGAVGAAAVFFNLKFFLKPRVKKQTMKMLTQDGKLVEVDISHVKKADKKASNKDLQEWVKR